MIPDLLFLKAQIMRGTLDRWVPQVRTLGERVNLPEFTTFKSPTSGPARPLADFDFAAIAEHQVRFEAPEGTFLSLSANPKLSSMLVQASYPCQGDEKKCRRAQRVLPDLLRELFATGELEEGFVRRIGKPVEGVPLTPVGQGYVALVTTDAAVDNAYADSSAFWNAWDLHEQTGEHHLLARSVEAATFEEWFRAVFEKEWAMARAARPGQTRIGIRRAPPGCEAYLMAGKGCLREVGARDGNVELAAYVPPGTHIPAWEILSLNEALLGGKRTDGSKIASLRVVFRDERMARAEGTPLLDIGAQVVYMGRDGLYHAMS